MPIQFCSRPPEDHALPSMDLIRTPAGGALTGIITSHEPIAVPTHWHGGQTMPCTGSECPACAQLKPKTWHVYLGLWGPQSAKHVIFECTASAAEKLYAWLETRDSLRLAQLAAARRGKRENGKVELMLKPISTAHLSLPEAPDLRAQLTRIWRINESKTATENPGYANTAERSLATAAAKPGGRPSARERGVSSEPGQNGAAHARKTGTH